MASIQIPNLPAVTGLTGAELFEGVQAGTSVKISLDQIIAAVYGNDPLEFPIPVYLGGTGLSTFTVGDIMYASATQTLSKLADVALGNAIISGGVGAAPSYGKIGLTTHVDGVLPVANGGTNQSAALTQYGLIYGNTTTSMASTAAGTSTTLLHGNASGAPTWSAVSLTADVSGVLPVLNGGTGVTTSTGTGSVVLSDSPALTGNVTVATNSASAAVTINQTGAGNAFVVEDSTSPDATPFVIDATGNVGIGTASPTSILDIYTATPTFNFRGDGATNITSTRSSNNSGGPNVNFIKARGTTASQTAVASSDYMGFLNFAAYGGATNRTIAQIYGQVSTYTSDTDISSSISFTTTPTGSVTPVDRMRIDSSGNVGIGTTSPTSAANYKFVTVQGGSNGGGYSIFNNSGVDIARFQTDAASGISLYNYSATLPTLFVNNSVEAMRITATGNVGIGTGSPGSVLDVVGTSVTDIFHVRNGTTYFAVGVTSGGASAVNAFQTGVGAQQLQFQTTGGTSYFGGNVGIGTTTPNSLLHVAGGGAIIGDFATNSLFSMRRAEGTIAAPTQVTAAAILGAQSFTGLDNTSTYRDVAQIRAISDGAITSTSSPGSLAFRTTASGAVLTTENMRITSDGNVGIGTASPGAKLEVAGQILASGSSNTGFIAATTTASIAYAQFQNSVRSWQLRNEAAGSFTIRDSTASLNRVAIDTSGNVTVGGSITGGSLVSDSVITDGFITHANGTLALAFGTDGVCKVTPTATGTFTTTVPPAGTRCTLIVLTTGVTSFTMTFGTGFKTTGTLATGTVAARYYVFQFISDGTSVIEASRTIAIA
jgi:hypothetical protein